ncbi:MAG TPA: hypothetical protein VGP02_17945 [Mycobacteriales bacterium]|nr:hypothetical protein [Mycobacteriales bacterium]
MTAGAYLLNFLAALLGMLDPMVESPPGEEPYGWAYLIVSACLTLRGLRVGIKVTDDWIIVRSLLRTRRINRRDLLNARTADYGGLWGLSDIHWVMLELHIRGRPEPLEVPNVFARRRSRKVQRIAVRLRQLRSTEPQELQPTVHPAGNPPNSTQQAGNDE